MRLLIALVMLLVGCASAHPRYVHVQDNCIQNRELGFTRIMPTFNQIEDILPVLELDKWEHIIYWYESSDDRLKIGIKENGNLAYEDANMEFELAIVEGNWKITSDSIERVCLRDTCIDCA